MNTSDNRLASRTRNSWNPRSATTAVACATTLAMLCTIVSFSAPASGATVEYEWGRHGKSQLVDTSTKPGASCQYVNGALTAIVVKPPKVWPRKAYVMRKNDQWVGWLPVLRRMASDGSWEDVARPEEPFRYHLWSYDPAVLGQSHTFESPSPGTYKVAVKIEWYETPPKKTQLVGGRTHVIEHYAASPDEGSCTNPLDAAPSPSPSSSTPPSSDVGSPVWWGNATRASLGSQSSRFEIGRGLDPITGDFDGDRRGDIFWYSPGGTETAWWGKTDRTFDKIDSQIQVGSGYTPVAGDYDGDGYDDIYWFASGSTPEVMWWGGAGRTWQVRNDYQVNSVWDQLIAGDYNGDGYDDIFFYRNSDHSQPCGNTLSVVYWHGKADRSQLNAGSTSSGSTHCYYKVFAADLDGNGSDDMLAYGLSPNSRDYITFHTPSYSTGKLEMPYGFRPVLGDFDGDGRADIFWFTPSGTDSQWWGVPTNSQFRTETTAVSMDGNYFPISHDFDGDGKYDIFWYEG